MYYKVVNGNDVVDILRSIKYVKYQKEHDILLLCDISEAQAILSSNGLYGWHIDGLFNLPTDKDNTTYEIKEITKYEYDLLKTKKEYEKMQLER
jgi:hypothetical protein